MIVINGSVTDELKQHLMQGGTHPVARIHGNLIIAGGNDVDMVVKNLWNPGKNPVEQGSISSSTGGESTSTTRLRNAGYINVKPSTTYKFDSNIARVFVIEFSEEGEKPVDSSGWMDMPVTYTTTATTQHIRLTLANTGNTNIDVDDFEWLKIEEV